MTTDQPFNPYGWKKYDFDTDGSIMNPQKACHNTIGIDRYIPYMVIKTDNYNVPELQIWSFKEEDGYIAASDLPWVSFQNNDGIYWILNGGNTLDSEALLQGGKFVWIIKTTDEFNNETTYISEVYEYNTTCPVEIKLDSCSDVFPYLFESGINESNFTVDADIRIWTDYGELNSKYETNFDKTIKKNNITKINSVKVTKFSLIKLKLSNSMADMIQAMATFNESVITIGDTSHKISNPTIETEFEDEDECGSCILSWETSVISTSGCCGKISERIILPIAIEYEGTITDWVDHTYITNGETKSLQVGQYAILNSGIKMLVLKKPDGTLHVVENLSSGDILHWRNHDYSSSSLYAYRTDNDPNTPPTAEVLIGFINQSRVGTDVYLQTLVISPTQIRVTINGGTPIIRSSTSLLYGTLNVGNIATGSTLWIEVLDSLGNWIEDTDSFNVTV